VGGGRWREGVVKGVWVCEKGRGERGKRVWWCLGGWGRGPLGLGRVGGRGVFGGVGGTGSGVVVEGGMVAVGGW